MDYVIAHNDSFRDRAEFNGNVVLVKFNNHPDTTLEDAINVVAEAAVAYGKYKQVLRKTKGR